MDVLTSVFLTQLSDRLDWYVLGILLLWAAYGYAKKLLRCKDTASLVLAEVRALAESERMPEETEFGRGWNCCIRQLRTIIKKGDRP